MRLLVAFAGLLVLVAVAQLVIVWRYTHARDAMLLDAQKTVVRSELDQDDET